MADNKGLLLGIGAIAAVGLGYLVLRRRPQRVAPQQAPRPSVPSPVLPGGAPATPPSGGFQSGIPGIPGLAPGFVTVSPARVVYTIVAAGTPNAGRLIVTIITPNGRASMIIDRLDQAVPLAIQQGATGIDVYNAHEAVVSASIVNGQLIVPGDVASYSAPLIPTLYGGTAAVETRDQLGARVSNLTEGQTYQLRVTVTNAARKGDVPIASEARLIITSVAVGPQAGQRVPLAASETATYTLDFTVPVTGITYQDDIKVTVMWPDRTTLQTTWTVHVGTAFAVSGGVPGFGQV